MRAFTARTSRPRTTRAGLVVMGFVLLTIVLAPAAGLAEKKSVEKIWTPPRPVPDGRTMQFLRGRLTTDGLGGFKIGDVRVRFEAGAELSLQGAGHRTTAPRGGSEVILMGQLFGKTLLVRHGVQLQSLQSIDNPAREGNITWSEANPAVGWGTAPN